MLHGHPAFRYEYDASRKLFKKSSLPLTYKTNFKYQDIADKFYHISNIIREVDFKVENTNISVSYTKKHIRDEDFADNPMFYISFQTSKRRCLTREWRDNDGLKRIKDSLYLDIDFLNAEFHGGIIVELFVHYPGQLVRSLDSPVF